MCSEAFPGGLVVFRYFNFVFFFFFIFFNFFVLDTFSLNSALRKLEAFLISPVAIFLFFSFYVDLLVNFQWLGIFMKYIDMSFLLFSQKIVTSSVCLSVCNTFIYRTYKILLFSRQCTILCNFRFFLLRIFFNIRIWLSYLFTCYSVL